MFLKTVKIYLQTKNLADDKQNFTHFALFAFVSFDIFLLLHYFHFSLLYILSSVEIFKTKWYSY